MHTPRGRCSGAPPKEETPVYQSLRAPQHWHLHVSFVRDTHRGQYLGSRGSLGQYQRKRMDKKRLTLKAQAPSHCTAMVRWSVRSPHDLLHCFQAHLQLPSLEAWHYLQSQLQLPSQLAPFQLRGGPFGCILSQAPTLQQLSTCLKDTLKLLTQPPGGRPVGVLEGVPGWHLKLVRGPRRWLGLRPGRPFSVADAGPWWTASGLLHLLQNVPTGVWLALLLWLGYQLVKTIQNRLRARQEWGERQKCISAAKASDLLLQRNRMLRAVGGANETDLQGEQPAALAAEPHWQDPTEWDPATRKQWDDFMRKSKALRIQRERWWDIDTADDTPHHKTEHDKLRRAGQLPNYG